MGSTKYDLVLDLERKKWSAARDEIIARARKGYYHDFETTLATPKMQLDADLRAAGFADLADKVRNGDYDDERWTKDSFL